VTKNTITKYTELMNNPDLKKLWIPAMSKELHRLVQGKEGINVATMTKSGASQGPNHHLCMHLIDHWSQKDDLNRDCIPVGGNLIDYPYELMTRTADMVSSKIMRNSVISMPNAKFGSADIKNLYIETPLD
jgi:hypothetical protein